MIKGCPRRTNEKKHKSINPDETRNVVTKTRNRHAVKDLIRMRRTLPVGVR
jgi:hypothetical protein